MTIPESDVSPTAERRRELDTLGARAIQLYQSQLALADRIWSYLSAYSILMIAFAAAISSTSVRQPPLYLYLAFGGFYLALGLGTHRTLSLTLLELERIRGIASTKSPYNFVGTSRTGILRFHLLMIAAVLLLFVLAIWSRRSG